MILFKDIDLLLTLEGAAQKSGRRINDRDLSPIQDAAMVTKGEKILWVGEKKKLPAKFKKARTVSLKGRTVLPAFVESHTHLIFGGNRSNEFELRNQGMSYQEIARAGGGIRSTVAATRKESPATLLKTAQSRVNEFLRQGVTTVEIKSGYGLDLKSEEKILGICKRLKGARVVSTYLGPHAVPPEHQSAASYMSEVLDTHLPYLAKKKLSRRADIFIEDGYFSIPMAETYLAKLREMNWDITIHADQLTRTGATELGARLGARSVDHVLKVSDSDIQALAESETTAVLLPAADLYLKVAYPPARKIIDAGGRVALATDFNPGTAPTQDLSLVGVLARVEMKMSLAETIAAYTVGGAYALGLQNELGSLEAGKLADFVVIEGNYTDLFYQVGKSPVVEVWKESKQVWKTS